MNALEAALIDVAKFLDGAGIDYMVIGGFANLHWGTPRLTQDLDITVRIEEASLSDFVTRLTERFSSLVQDPAKFVNERRVIPVKATGGIKVDVVLEGHPWVSRAMDRAVNVDIGGQAIRFCTAEDLILHKLASERPRDFEDAEGIVLRQAGRLDRSYLDPLVGQLATALERRAVSTFYRACLRKAGVEPAGHSGAAQRPGRGAARPAPRRRKGGHSDG